MMAQGGRKDQECLASGEEVQQQQPEQGKELQSQAALLSLSVTADAVLT